MRTRLLTMNILTWYVQSWNTLGIKIICVCTIIVLTFSWRSPDNTTAISSVKQREISRLWCRELNLQIYTIPYFFFSQCTQCFLKKAKSVIYHMSAALELRNWVTRYSPSVIFARDTTSRTKVCTHLSLNTAWCNWAYFESTSRASDLTCCTAIRTRLQKETKCRL